MHAPARQIRVLADALGERFLEAGPGGLPVEALAVTPELARRDQCRSAVVARAVALSKIPGSSVARVFDAQATGHEADRLVVRSEWTEGERLSSLIARMRDGRRPLSVGQVFYLLGRAVAAVRELHASGPGVCHGALSASRFVLATDGRLVLRDCVFGGALAALDWSAAQCREVLGLEVPELADIPAITPLTDQFQLGLLAVHLISGSASLPAGSAAMAAAFADARLPGRGGAEVPLPDDLRALVTRMLLLSSDGPFRSLLALERALDAAMASAPDSPPEPPEIAIEDWSETPPPTPPGPPSPPASGRPAASPSWPAVKPAEPLPPPSPPASGRPAASPSWPAVKLAEPPQPSWPPRPPEPRQPAFRLQEWHAPGEAYFDAGVDDGFNVPSRNAAPVEQPGRPRTRTLVVAFVVLGALGGLAYYFGGAQALENWRTPPRGVLRLDSKPVGATVTVDGVQKGQTPLILSVAPGSYRIEFSLGDESRAMTVPVEHDNEAFQLVSLYPPGPPGTLEIASAPPGAAVSVDGEPRGTTPLTLSDITPGEHVVAAQSPVAKVQQTVEVLAGAVVPVTLPLSGFLDVKAPFEVAVFDRAKQLGTSRAGTIPLPAGRRLLSFVNDELQYEEDRSVEVPAGGSARVELVPPKGTLNFTADTEAEVFLDSRPLGSTPLSNVPVALGPHEVLYTHPKWGDQRYAILVSLGSPTRLHAVMETKTKSITVTRAPQPPRYTRRR